MTMKHYLTVLDLTAEETGAVLDLAAKIKAEGAPRADLAGKHVGLYFEKPSVRTRTSFTVGVHQLGGQVIELGSANTKVGKGEHVEDFSRVMSGYVDALVARVFSQDELQMMADVGSIPVVNALSDATHPCQALADYLTIQERLGSIAGKKVAFVGEGNNVARSLGVLGTLLGAEVVVASPEGYGLSQDALTDAAQLPGSLSQVVDPHAAVQGADVIYTDTWISMGQEAEAAERREIFHAYRVTDELVARAADDVIALHCLPAVRGEEITRDIMYSPRSAIWQQAENRLHAQKALLVHLLG